MREPGTETVLSKNDAPLLGAVFDERYRVGQFLRHNGSGGLFLATDLREQRPVVIKVLAAELGGDPVAAEQFAQDARASCLPEHPNLVTTLAAGEVDGRPYLVTTFARGDTVADRVRVGSLALPTAATIAIQVCAALEHLHDLGLIHHAVRPENLILIDDDGPRVVLDFGLFHGPASSFAPLHVNDVSFGCPEYLAPELAKGVTNGDHRSDLYALGVTFYELVTGRLPFYASSTAELLLRHMFSPPPPASSFQPHLPWSVDQFLERAIAKDPDARYQTAGEMREALQGLLDASEVVLTELDLVPMDGSENEEPPTIAPSRPAVLPAVGLPPANVAGTEEPDPAWAPAKRRLRLLLLLLLLTLLAGGGVAAWTLTRSDPPAPLPRTAAPAPQPRPAPGVAAAEAAPSAAAQARPAPALTKTPSAARPPAEPARQSPAPLPTKQAARRRRDPRRSSQSRGKTRGRRAARTVKTKKAVPTPVLAGLGVKSTPTGASVVAGTKRLGQTPLANARLAPGDYQLTVSKPGFKPWKTQVTLAGGASVRLTARLVPHPGVLHLVVKDGDVATWASISLDGEALTESHTVRRKVSAGHHRITVRRSGYRRVTRMIVIPAGGTRKVRIQLQRKEAPR